MESTTYNQTWHLILTVHHIGVFRLFNKCLGSRNLQGRVKVSFTNAGRFKVYVELINKYTCTKFVYPYILQINHISI